MGMPPNLPDLSDAPVVGLVRPGYYKGRIEEAGHKQAKKTGTWGLNLKISLNGQDQLVFAFFVYQGSDWALGMIRQLELAIGLSGTGTPKPDQYAGKKVGVYVGYDGTRTTTEKRSQPVQVYPRVKEFVPYDSSEVEWQGEDDDDIPF